MSVLKFFGHQFTPQKISQFQGSGKRLSFFQNADPLQNAYSKKQMQLNRIQRNFMVSVVALGVCAVEDVPFAIMNLRIILEVTKETLFSCQAQAGEEAGSQETLFSGSQEKVEDTWGALQIYQYSLVMNLVMCGVKCYYFQVLLDLWKGRKSLREDLNVLRDQIAEKNKNDDAASATNAKEATDATNAEKVTDARNAKKVTDARNVEKVTDARNAEKVIDARNLTNTLNQVVPDH